MVTPNMWQMCFKAGFALMFSCVVHRAKHLEMLFQYLFFITLPMEEKVNLLKSLSRKEAVILSSLGSEQGERGNLCICPSRVLQKVCEGSLGHPNNPGLVQ